MEDSINEFFLSKKEVLENEKIFIDKPVEDIMKKIETSEKSKIILSGTEGSGKKLTILKYMNTNDNLFVYFKLNKFDYYNLSKRKDRSEAYIESVIASELLKLLTGLGLHSQMLELGTNMPYIQGNIDVLKKYEAGDLISTLLYRIKKMTDKKIVFVVDNMDMLSEYIQQIILKYFDIFDQSIILSSDLLVYSDIETRNVLTSNGFDIINVDYAKNTEVLKQIIDARISYHNEKSNLEYKFEPFENMLNEDVIENIARLANGNIRHIFCVAKLVYTKCNIELHNKDVIGNYVVSALDRLNKGRRLTPVKKLYL